MTTRRQDQINFADYFKNGLEDKREHGGRP